MKRNAGKDDSITGVVFTFARAFREEIDELKESMLVVVSVSLLVRVSSLFFSPAASSSCSHCDFIRD